MPAPGSQHPSGDVTAESGWLGPRSENPSAPAEPSYPTRRGGKTPARLSSKEMLRQSPGHPNFPSNWGLHPRSCSLPSLRCRSCHLGVCARFCCRCGSASRFLLTDSQLQLPNSLQTALQLGAGPSGDGWQLRQLGQRLHPPQATLQPGQVLLGRWGGGTWSEGTSKKHKNWSRKTNSFRTRCRRLVVPGGAVPACVPPSCSRPGVLAEESTARSREGGVGGQAVAGDEGLLACKRAEER